MARIADDDVLIGLIKKQGGGGQGGTSNYEDLDNKPQIAGTTLQGNKSLADLGIASAQSVENITNGVSINNFAGVETALADKVDKVEGKGLSTNDYTDADAAIVAGVTTALAGKADAITVNAILDGQSIDSFGDVETALSGKQNTLTAGDYIEFDGNEISVNREIPTIVTSYEFKTKDTSGANAAVTIIKRSNGEVISSTDYHHQEVNNRYITIDDTFYFGYNSSLAAGWAYKLIVASDDHSVNFVKNWDFGATVDYTETFTTDHSGESLVQKAQMDTALAGKQNVLTFDTVPTDGSTNPVESNGVYDALATKADLADLAPAFSDSTAYTVGQYVSYDGNIYKCTSAHSAGAWVAGDFTLIAIGNELNTLNSNLTSLGLSVVNGKLCQTYSA